MADRRLVVTIFRISAVILLVATGRIIERTEVGRQRKLATVVDPRTVEAKANDSRSLDIAALWCSEPIQDSLPYKQCNPNDIVYRIPLEGGMTNALKMVLLGAILAFEENRCFFVDESQSHLNNFDRTSYSDGGFISRYFERIGLSQYDATVNNALREGRVRSLTWRQVWVPLRSRRVPTEITSIPALGINDLAGHDLKALFLQRLWRPLPYTRELTCRRLQEVGLMQQEYIAFSIRRGDKGTVEKFEFLPMNKYIDEAETVIKERFGGIAPPIFVATDDCTVLATLRKVRPTWTYISECDSHATAEGFALQDMQKWTKKDYDDHFGKFFVELYAMANSKVFIGISYTNVSWFVYFMRGGKLQDFILLDVKDNLGNMIDTW